MATLQEYEQLLVDKIQSYKQRHTSVAYTPPYTKPEKSRLGEERSM